MNAEAAPKYTMRRPTLPGLGEGWYESAIWTTCPTRFAGVVGDSMPTRKDGKHGKPTQVTFDRSTAASGCWLEWVAEGLVLPMKLGNAGGGKEP